MNFLKKLCFCTFIVLFLSNCGKKGLFIRIGDQDILALGSVDSCNFVQNSQGARVSWKASRPFHIIIGPGVPAEYDSTIYTAANIWNDYQHANLIQVHRDNSMDLPPADDRNNIIYWNSDWPSDIAQEQARTVIKWEISKLRDADIKVNAKYFSFYKIGDTDTVGKISLLSLMIHEMGHALGLKHIGDAQSVMQPYLASNTDRNAPGKVDTDSLGCEY